MPTVEPLFKVLAHELLVNRKLTIFQESLILYQGNSLFIFLKMAEQKRQKYSISRFVQPLLKLRDGGEIF
ncbi:hypothetical protein [Undibacterium squillarum]|uniref:hypothetical protein n=1 Tax=Undibacterium squillarum TaxID=1131567 RepID=UPI0035AED71E